MLAEKQNFNCRKKRSKKIERDISSTRKARRLRQALLAAPSFSNSFQISLSRSVLLLLRHGSMLWWRFESLPDNPSIIELAQIQISRRGVIQRLNVKQLGSGERILLGMLERCDSLRSL
jgi:hypothetical protein